MKELFCRFSNTDAFPILLFDRHQVASFLSSSFYLSSRTRDFRLESRALKSFSRCSNCKCQSFPGFYLNIESLSSKIKIEEYTLLVESLRIGFNIQQI